MKKYQRLYEAVIRPEEYLKSISKKLDSIQKVITQSKSLKNLSSKLNTYFKSNHIEFIPVKRIENGIEEYIQFGINEGRTKSDKYGTIGIFLNPNVLNIFNNDQYYNEFVKWLLFVLKHELVHRGQGLKIKDVKIKAEVLKKDYKDQVDYLSDKQEIMSRAWEIVELFKLSNFSDDEIIDLLKSDNNIKKMNNTLAVYYSLFNTSSKELNTLYKYMYEYIKG